MSLEQKHCVPCKKGGAPLTVEKARELLKNIDGWVIEDEGRILIRSFKFNNYLEALEFVSAISVIAERENHHPDITFGWGYATILFTTHNVKGLSENDFIMAAKVTSIAEGRLDVSSYN